MIYISFLALLAAAAAMDIARLRIPNALTMAIAILFAVPAVVNGAALGLQWHVASFAIVFAVGWILFACNVLGGGDVKLFAATALWVGLDLLPLQLVYTALLGVVVLAALVLARNAMRMLGGRMQTIPESVIPCSLRSDGGVPYGVAIAAATILVSDRIPAAVWVF